MTKDFFVYWIKPKPEEMTIQTQKPKFKIQTGKRFGALKMDLMHFLKFLFKNKIFLSFRLIIFSFFNVFCLFLWFLLQIQGIKRPFRARIYNMVNYDSTDGRTWKYSWNYDKNRNFIEILFLSRLKRVNLSSKHFSEEEEHSQIISRLAYIHHICEIFTF